MKKQAYASVSDPNLVQQQEAVAMMQPGKMAPDQ